MARQRIPLLLLLTLTLGLAAGACDSESDLAPDRTRPTNQETETFDVTIKWQIEEDFQCIGLLKGEAVPFDKITLGLYQPGPENEPKKVEFIDNIDCSAFEHTVPRLPAGNYDLEIQAWATYDEKQLPFYDAHEELIVDEDLADEGAVLLSLTKGKGAVSIGWGFDNYLQCGANDISEVVITVFDEGIEEALDPITEKCDIGRLELDGLRWSSYSITVEGFEAQAESATWLGHSDASPVEVKPGELIDAAVVMSPAE